MFLNIFFCVFWVVEVIIVCEGKYVVLLCILILSVNGIFKNGLF